MASSFTATADVLSLSNKKYKVSSGPSSSKADAENEVKAKLALTVGAQVLKVTVTETYDSTAGFILHAADTFEDAVIVVKKANPDLPGNTIYRNIRMENMSLEYLVPDSGGLVDTTGDVGALITAFKDGRGEGGYTASPGDSRYEK